MKKSNLKENTTPVSNSTAFKEILKVFLPVAQKIIELDKLPTITLKKIIQNDEQPTMACFDPAAYSLEIAVVNRHPIDVLRSLAHELVHAKQLRNNIDIDTTTGSKEENEANAIAGTIMRDFIKQYPQYLKEPSITECDGDCGMGDGMSTTDILANGSGDQTQLGVLGIGNFNFPTRLGKIKKRLISQYDILK